MTGPEHYEEAESLLASAVEAEAADDGRYCLAAAQAHATLALAAATALTTASPDGEAAWHQAAGTKAEG